MNKVDTQAKQYEDNIASWIKVRDCVEGSKAVKAKSITYLPTPSPSDNDATRYANYLLRAVFVNTTARTLEGLAGAVLQKPPKIELPEQLEYMNEDADGSGCSIFQCAKETLSDVIQVGRAGLLVDFPDVGIEAPVTLADEQALNLRASIVQYKAEDIINWKTAKIGAETVLKLVVLTELRETLAGEIFENECHTVYRVLALDNVGNYYQEEWVKSGIESSSSSFSLSKERVYPRYNDGSLLTRIPFIFIGSKDLKPSVDKSPLLDLVEINLSHYRNSADLEEMAFMIGQPTLIVHGLTDQWIKTVWKGNALKVGARSSIQLPKDSDAHFAQINESQIANTIMERKEAQMVAIGARVITSNVAGVEAAQTVRLRMSGEASILSNITDNVSEGYLQALRIAALFMGAKPESIVFELNSDFFADKLTPDESRMLTELWQKGVYPKSDLRDALRKGEILRKDRTDEELDKELDEEFQAIPTLDLSNSQGDLS